MEIAYRFAAARVTGMTTLRSEASPTSGHLTVGGALCLWMVDDAAVTWLYSNQQAILGTCERFLKEDALPGLPAVKSETAFLEHLVRRLQQVFPDSAFDLVPRDGVAAVAK